MTGILLLALLCAGLGFCYWKAHQKAKEKNREIAILRDQVSSVGFQRYIDELLSDSNSSNGTIVRHDATGQEARERPPLAEGREGVRSQPSSVYSEDIARAL